ncbi:hypothetical protein AVEN_29873-1 [Araneus ventricosus]|uniref:Uncharacterized protein n=1 Tax=Araneus ventricosus TaxID=182803 RepID=A0A4Y2X8J7_ARAVE|nr:hypothetical protein AVEN_265576-1 [Araneus ventricosus]GBO45921.1 hypothetical protein AVEN_29873-1 [Araneus ventricosus]
MVIEIPFRIKRNDDAVSKIMTTLVLEIWHAFSLLDESSTRRKGSWRLSGQSHNRPDNSRQERPSQMTEGVGKGASTPPTAAIKSDVALCSADG